MKVLIPPGTAEATMELHLDAGVKMAVSSGKLAGAETVTFQLLEDDVVTPGDLYQDDVIRQLTATHNATIITGPIDLQVKKSITTLAVGVYGKG